MPLPQITKERKEQIEQHREKAALRNEYYQYTLKFEEMGDQLKNGLNIPEGYNQSLGKLSYSEWLLEQILLSLRKT